MNSLEELKTAVINGRRKDVLTQVAALLAAGVAPAVLLEEALIPAMGEVGQRFKRSEIFVPELLVSARAMKEAMKVIEPMLIEAGIKPQYTAVIGTVEGDLHDIGKNLVATMWRGAGIEVVDLGVNVTAAQFVAAVHEHKPDVVGLSALLTTTMPAMREVVQALRNSSHAEVRILVGGAPITQDFAKSIGADGYARDAASAVDAARAALA
jgi:5-methyltetrahydrofolate--homocysteine methyltransferase